MEKARHRSFGTTIIKLLLVFPAILNVLANLGGLIKAEAHTAANNSVKMLILLIFISLALVINWIGLLSLLMLYLVSLNLGWLLSIVIPLAINTLLMIILILWILKVKDRLLFPETKRIIHMLSQK